MAFLSKSNTLNESLSYHHLSCRCSSFWLPASEGERSLRRIEINRMCLRFANWHWNEHQNATHLILAERTILRTLGAQQPVGLLIGVAVFGWAGHFIRSWINFGVGGQVVGRRESFRKRRVVQDREIIVRENLFRRGSRRAAKIRRRNLKV